jgi:uncharacterized membrane protein YqaE (UPF0057 family)
MTQFFTTDLLLALLGMFLPPVPVGIKRGCGVDLVINLVLCLLGIPAVLHAWYIIIKYPDDGIPFIDVRRGRYDIIPDVENEPATPESEHYVHVNVSFGSNQDGSNNGPEGGSNNGIASNSANVAGSSTNPVPPNPPPYSDGDQGSSPRLDNKIQYD